MWDRRKKHLLLNHPFWLVALVVAVLSSQVSFQRDFVQTDILDGCPDNGQATGLGREHINLIGALPHIAEETFNGIGRLNVPMHRLRKRIKRQEVLFVLSQASYRFWIALAYLALKAANWVNASGFVGCSQIPRVRPGHRHALVWGWQRAHCVVYAPDSVDEAWPKTVPRRQRAIHHAHRSR